MGHCSMLWLGSLNGWRMTMKGKLAHRLTPRHLISSLLPLLLHASDEVSQ